MKRSVLAITVVAVSILSSCLIGYAIVNYLLPNYTFNTTIGKVFSFGLPVESVERYGFYYPLTFMFSLSSNSSICQYRYSVSEKWRSVPVLPLADVFNGIEGYRVADSTVFVSLAFKGHSKLQIKLDNQTEFNGIAEYYDSRNCTVVHTLDDCYGNENYPDPSLSVYKAVCDAFQRNKVVATLGMVTAMSEEHLSTEGIVGKPVPMTENAWNIFQNEINEGWITVASHGWTHSSGAYPNPTYSSIEQEVKNGRDDILAHLTLRYGQYVPCWIERWEHQATGLQI